MRSMLSRMAFSKESASLAATAAWVSSWTYAVSESVEITFAYMHAFENTVEGESSIIPGPPEQGGMGGGEADLTMSQDSFGLGVGLLF